MNITITEINVYPVKSLRGIGLEEAVLTPQGVALDRAWMLHDSTGQFLSQRNVPSMTRIRTRIDDGWLVFGRQGMEDFGVEIAETRNLPEREARVWEDQCTVADEGDDVAQWFQQALETDEAPRLVRMGKNFQRAQRRPERYGDGTHTYFADSAPYLVANQASLGALNEILVARNRGAVPMNRFRANIVVEGLAAFEEQNIVSLACNRYRLGLRHPRERCVIVTMDQRTGHRDPTREPFKSLTRLNPMPGNPRGPAFGMLSVLEHGADARIRVGDRLEVIRA